MSSADSRTEFLRRDCRTCHGNGYVTKGGQEENCDVCGGSGMEEKEVAFKFDGPRTKDEIEDLWNDR